MEGFALWLIRYDTRLKDYVYSEGDGDNNIIRAEFNLDQWFENKSIRISELKNKMHTDQTSTNMRRPASALHRVAFAKCSFWSSFFPIETPVYNLHFVYIIVCEHCNTWVCFGVFAICVSSFSCSDPKTLLQCFEVIRDSGVKDIC